MKDELKEKEIAVAAHIRNAAPDGCMCEPCISAREAFGAEVERLSKLVEDCPGCKRKRIADEYCFGCAFDAAHKAYGAAESKLSQLQQLDSPLPLKDVLSQLADAADHLLNGHDCDNHGWEEVRDSAKKAREIVAILNGGQQ